MLILPQRQLNHGHRLDVQDRARRLKKEPRHEEQAKLEQLRQLLNNQFGILDSVRQRIQGAVRCLIPFPEAYNPVAFDGLDDDISQAQTEKERSYRPMESTQQDDAGSDAAIQGSNECFTAEGTNSDDTSILPELRTLPIPSAMDRPLDHHRDIEMRLRVRQADALLTSLRELIADKSFHYSHILHLATRQPIRSRARSKIATLNAEISLCCRAYTRCHTAMMRLQVPDEIMSGYRPLTRDDIKASTALLKPNEPGSSTLRLSWIWQTQTCGVDSTKGTLIECMDFLL